MSCSQTLAGITRDCNGSKGGIITVYIANYDDVTNIEVDGGSDGDVNEIITGITMAADKKFQTYQFRKNTGNMVSTLNVDATTGTNYVSTDLTLLFSRMETVKRLEMKALSLGETAVIVKDSNGKFWYLGEEEPVTAISGTGETGTNKTDGNKYTIVLQDANESYPKEVDPIIISNIIE